LRSFFVFCFPLCWAIKTYQQLKSKLRSFFTLSLSKHCLSLFASIRFFAHVVKLTSNLAIIKPMSEYIAYILVLLSDQLA